MFARKVVASVSFGSIFFVALSGSAWADLFSAYSLTETFSLPPNTAAFDPLPDGRLMAIAGANVFVESGVLSRTFTNLGPLPPGDIGAFGVSFVRVSPDGTKLAIGNNGGASFSNYQVGVFSFPGLTGTWFNANHFDGEWFDNHYLAISSGGQTVTMLDTTSANPANPTNATVVSNIGVASAGITFDGAGNLYTGDGFSPTETGRIKAFRPAEWLPAVTGGASADFQADGVEIVDILSAASLGFDGEGNLHISGGDFSGPHVDFAALAHGTAIQAALSGGGALDPANMSQVRRLDPDMVGFDFYTTNHNRVTNELYVQNFGDSTVYVYRVGQTVPTTSTVGLFVLAIALATLGARRARSGMNA